MTEGKILDELRKIVAKVPRDGFHGNSLKALKKRRLIWVHPVTGNLIITPGGRKLLKSP